MILRNILNVLRSPDSAEGGTPAISDAQKLQNALAASGQGDVGGKPAGEGGGDEGQQTPPDNTPPAKPSKSTTPPKSVLEMTFDDGEPEGDTTIPGGDKQVTPPAKKVDLSTKPPTGEKVTDDKKGQQQKPDGRDYTGFTPDETLALRQMPNHAFTFAAKVLREHKALKEKQTSALESYLQHEEGYSLTPEYRDANSAVQLAEMEVEHWKQQLINVRNGKPWQTLVGFDAQGNPVVGPDRYKPSDEAEIDIQNTLQYVVNQTAQRRGAVDLIKQQFKQRVDGDYTAIQQERAKRFGWVNDPKILDDTIEIPEKGKVALKDFRNGFLSMFPKYLARGPMADTAADLFVTVQLYAARIRELEAGHKTAEQLKSDMLAGEPPINPNSGQRSTGDEFTMDGMPD